MAAVVEFLLAGFTDNSGQPLSGGKVYTYAAGTSTPKDTYTDNLGATPETNPVILDSNGRKQIYGTGSYKFLVKDSDDVLLYTFDNLFFGNEAGITFLGTTTGSPNAYIATPSPALSAYEDGMIYTFQASFTNTGAATLNISGLGAKSVASYAGQIISGFTYSVRYSSSTDAFIIINPDPGYATSHADMVSLEAAGVPIVVRQAITLTGDLTLTVPLIIDKGGVITTGPRTLTINGPLTAGIYKIFTATGGVIAFGSKVHTVYPEWWGCVADGSTDDTLPLQEALTAGANREVKLGTATYKITAQVSMAANSKLIGVGYNKSVLFQATANASILVVNNDNEVAYIKFSGTGSLSTLGHEAIFFDPPGTGLIGKRVHVHDCYIDNTISTSAIGGNNMVDVWIKDNIIDLGVEGEHGIYLSGGSDRVYVVNNTISRTGTPSVASCRPVHIKGVDNSLIRGNYIYGTWDAYGIISTTLPSTNIQIVDNILIFSNANVKAIATGQGSQDDQFRISGNYTSGGTYGIWSQSSNTIIDGNVIYGTAQRGIEADGTTNDTSNQVIQNNVMIGCVGGIRYQAADANYTIQNNIINGTVASVGNGIEVNTGSIDGVVKGNNVNDVTGTPYVFGVIMPRMNNITEGVLHSGAATGISAAGTTISDATDLASHFNNITTVAANTGVQLWAAPIGSQVIVRNQGANTLKVYPEDASRDINGAGAGVAVSVAAGSMAIFWRTGAANWIGVEFVVAAA
jgi:hypothetical protein